MSIKFINNNVKLKAEGLTKFWMTIKNYLFEDYSMIQKKFKMELQDNHKSVSIKCYPKVPKPGC